MAEQTTMTLEQQRAAHAWQCAQGCNKDYVNLAKGLPALIMNSGLIQVFAFLHEKSKDEKRPHAQLKQHLCSWLVGRFDHLSGNNFDTFMASLIERTDPQQFQHVTAEAMAWLRWMRQIAPAAQASAAPQNA